MKKIALSIVGLSLITLVACGEKPQAENTEEQSEVVDETTAEEGAVKEENPEGHFGQIIEAEGAKTMEEFAGLMDGNDSVNVKLLAVAADVCQKKGCWMKVKTADGEEMRVRFKDYGFFVPKDLTGKQIVFEGVAFRDTTSVEDLKHYAEDGGKSEEEIAAITEPEINTSFIADGVVIVE